MSTRDRVRRLHARTHPGGQPPTPATLATLEHAWADWRATVAGLDPRQADRAVCSLLRSFDDAGMLDRWLARGLIPADLLAAGRAAVADLLGGP